MNEHASAANAAFVEELTRFHSLRGTTLKIPKFNRSPLDLEKLWHAVRKNGGSSKVCEMKHWAQIGRIFGGTTADKNVSNNIKRAFTKWLLPYERAFFPEEAMSSSGEHSVGTPRRKRQPNSTPSSNEKKSRSSSCDEKEPEAAVATLKLESLPPDTSLAPTSMALSALPANQRPYVSIPHSAESKICIILLPNTAAPDLSGMPGSAPQLQMPSQQVAQPSPANPHPAYPTANGHMKDEIGEDRGSMAIPVTAPLPTDQFMLSFLTNNNKNTPAAEADNRVTNVSVLFEDTQHPSNEHAPASGLQEPSDGRRPEQEAAATSNIPCSGLLCLLDSGMPVQTANMETTPMITPKSS